MNIIFDLDLKVMNGDVLVWVLEGKSVVVRDSNGRFFREIKRAVGRLRVYTDVSRLVYDVATC